MATKTKTPSAPLTSPLRHVSDSFSCLSLSLAEGLFSACLPVTLSFVFLLSSLSNFLCPLLVDVRADWSTPSHILCVDGSSTG